MRFGIAMAVTLPVALGLAACGDTTPAGEATPEPVEETAMPLDEVPVNLPQVPANSLTTIKYYGNYSQDGEDGKSTLRLNEDDTYEYTAPDGTVTSGKYKRMDDNNRILIEDFDGKAGVFSIADGAIYRLENEDSMPSEITVEGMYRKDDTDMQGGPGATTNTIADKKD